MFVCENNCIPLIKPVSMTYASGVLTITLPNLTLINGKKWRLVLCENSPVPAGTIASVQFITSGKTLPAVNGIGNVLRSDMLKKRCPMTLIYGWNVPHIMVCGTKCSAYVPTTTPSEPAEGQNSVIETKAKTKVSNETK